MIFVQIALQGDYVLKMTYMGWRRLQDGSKVHCLRAEKVPSGNIEEIANLVDARQVFRKRKTVEKQLALANNEPQTRGPSDREEAAKRTRLYVSKKQAAAAPSSTENGQKTSRRKAKTPERYEPQREPDWVITARQSHQGDAGASGSRPQEANPPLPQLPPPPPQQQQQPQQRQSTETMTVLVTRCLRNRVDLDRGLVGRSLARFFKLSKEEQETFGEILIELAAEPSLEAIEVFLHGIVGQNQW
jgi:hypothetical protein